MRRRGVVVADDAVVDLEQARAFYECQEQGLGDYFTTCLLSDLEALAFFGGVHVLCFGFYRALAKRFPFAIYYDLTAELVVVVAVLDMRREPSAIRRRLQVR
jgi:hypothetical protein